MQPKNYYVFFFFFPVWSMAFGRQYRAHWWIKLLAISDPGHRSTNQPSRPCKTTGLKYKIYPHHPTSWWVNLLPFPFPSHSLYLREGEWCHSDALMYACVNKNHVKRARGATRMARGGIRLVHGHTKSTLITYFSGMKIDPNYAFLHAFFLICWSCPFQNLSIWPKTHPFFQFCTFLHP